MAHYKLLYPTEYVAACDLPKDGAVAVIESLTVEKLKGTDGSEDSKPVVRFAGRKKRLVLCKTNAKSIAAKYGNETNDWKGKPVLLYPTTCQSFGATVECVRIKTDDMYLSKAAAKQSAPGGAA